MGDISKPCNATQFPEMMNPKQVYPQAARLSLTVLCCPLRPTIGGDEDADREVRIPCPDAIGLGCDIARLLLDFGLRII